MRPPADARVLALRVLADEHHVDVRRPATGERAGDPLQQPRRPHVGPEIQLLANREDDAPERDVVGYGRITDRAHQTGIVGAQDVEGILGHHATVLVPVRRAPRQLRPLQR